MRILFLAASLALTGVAYSQSPSWSMLEPQISEALEFRCMGPFRGGRSAAVCGIPGNPMLYYMGSTGGGVWRTKDGGGSWENISDGYFGGSIGAIAVSQSDPNVIYVGGGEVTVRGNVSSGSGMWKSVDAGKTWTHVGLPESRHITRIAIHPNDHRLIYAAVLGDIYKDSETRGVYKSENGGGTWKKVLFANEKAGAVDLIMDPTNPRILYASTWNMRRTPYSFSSGGPGSKLWKSTDSGESWEEISANKGFPTGTMGIIGITVSPVSNDQLYAIVEHKEKGGVYSSSDGGETWAYRNATRALRQRAWYYSRIYADSQEKGTVYVMNVRYHKSTDGGRSFKAYSAPHGDHHDLWIAPEDNQRMIIADDGGAQVSFDGGRNWSTYMNQPTAQFYRISVDTDIPYHILAAQQDNSTVRMLHRSPAGVIDKRHWEATAGGESAHLAADPNNPALVYGGNYGGFLARKDHKLNATRAINVWPDNPMGHGVEGMKYRFQWNFPVQFSKYNDSLLFTASQVLHGSTNGGSSWEVLSPDLTRNDSATFGPSGGPITKDNTGVEYYGTIFALAEDANNPNVMYAGSDDGLLHITRDGRKSWQDITPKGLPKYIQINSIEADPNESGVVYVAACNYKNGDYKPYLLISRDYGSSWKMKTEGIGEPHFVRVVRVDPTDSDILFAGTEGGLYISLNGGERWEWIGLNMPEVPITDLVIKDNSLYVATQGRSIWAFDELNVLHQLKNGALEQRTLLTPPITLLMPGYQRSVFKTAGQNYPHGMRIFFNLDQEPDSLSEISITLIDERGDTAVSVNKQDLGELRKGLNFWRWNLQYPKAKGIENLILWWADLKGPKAIPGTYKVVLTIGETTVQTDAVIKGNPITQTSQETYLAQYKFTQSIVEGLNQIHTNIREMRRASSSLSNWKKRISDEPWADSLVVQIDSVVKAISHIEQQLYQTQNESGQDPLNFPIKLNNKLAHLKSLMSYGEYPPTKQAIEVRDELIEEVLLVLDEWSEIKRQELVHIEKRLKTKDLPLIQY